MTMTMMTMTMMTTSMMTMMTMTMGRGRAGICLELEPEI